MENYQGNLEFPKPKPIGERYWRNTGIVNKVSLWVTEEGSWTWQEGGGKTMSHRWGWTGHRWDTIRERILQVKKQQMDPNTVSWTELTRALRQSCCPIHSVYLCINPTITWRNYQAGFKHFCLFVTTRIWGNVNFTTEIERSHQPSPPRPMIPPGLPSYQLDTCFHPVFLL